MRKHAHTRTHWPPRWIADRVRVDASQSHHPMINADENHIQFMQMKGKRRLTMKRETVLTEAERSHLRQRNSYVQ